MGELQRCLINLHNRASKVLCMGASAVFGVAMPRVRLACNFQGQDGEWLNSVVLTYPNICVRGIVEFSIMYGVYLL